MARRVEKKAFQVKGSNFLITGGTGSFGSTIVKKLLEQDCGFVRVYSRDESKHYFLQNSLQDSRVIYQIGDVRDLNSLKRALFEIDYVFHAAALKHVPASESNPYEYVKTNVEGSHNLLSALEESQVKSAVFLSTDKAVYPINAMGMTKAIMEKLVRSTRYIGPTVSCITRYGNVIGSRGSVIPYFMDCIKTNQPVKVTDFSMTRFVMSLDESVDLVMHAMMEGMRGDLFVRKSPAVRLDVLLESIELLLEKKAKRVEITGIRPGEKIHETLLNSEERTCAIDKNTFFRVPSVSSHLQHGKGIKHIHEEFRSDNSQLLSTKEMIAYLERNPEIQSLI